MASADEAALRRTDIGLGCAMTPEESRKQLKHLLLHAQFAEGERLARQIRTEAMQQNDLELATDATLRLGQFCFELLHYQDAWDAFADALAERAELYGSDHLRTTQARAWLAAVSSSLNRSAETRALLARATAAIPKDPAHDDRMLVVDVLRVVGFVETYMKRTDSALEHLRRAMELIESESDADELEVAGVCVLLGGAEQAAHHLARAEELYKRALDIRIRRLGEDNPLVAYCRNHVGVTQLFLGKPDEARAFVDKSIAGLEATFGNSPLTASSLSTRGAIHALEEDHREAVDTLQRALSMRERPGADTPDVAHTLLMLGIVQLGFEKPDLAEPHLRRATQILLPFHQTQLDSLFKSFNNAIMSMNVQHKYKEIIAFAEPILTQLQNEPLADPNFLGAVMTGLSTGYYGLGKASKAEKLLRRAMGVVESRLGPTARELEPILYNLAVVLEGMGRRFEANTYRQRADDILDKQN